MYVFWCKMNSEGHILLIDLPSAFSIAIETEINSL